ncbi:MAG: hypothetical protein LBC77_00965, partial [Spirochaetaceae bacterium]|nr:hypothetical protein [Spirochaetaceae bacterium]
VEESPQSDGNFVYARVLLQAALLDSGGKEICAWSENDRQGHANVSGARERALSRAEALITESGFAAALDAALAARVSL